jgi:hypothetical protein
MDVCIFVYRRKTVPVHVVGVRVEFRAVGRADQTLPEAHGRQTVPVRGVRTVFRPVRSSGAAQETPSAQERGGGGGGGAASAAADGPSVVQRRGRRPTPAEAAAPAADDVERRRYGVRAKGRRRVRRRRSAAGLQTNGAGLVIGERSHVIITIYYNINIYVIRDERLRGSIVRTIGKKKTVDEEKKKEGGGVEEFL